MVFLFDTGSALHWNSTKTDELAELARLIGFKTSDKKLILRSSFARS